MTSLTLQPERYVGVIRLQSFTFRIGQSLNDTVCVLTVSRSNNTLVNTTH